MHAGPLTQQQQKDEILSSTKSNEELSKIYGKSKGYISKFRSKNGKGVGRGGDRRSNPKTVKYKKVNQKPLPKEQVDKVKLKANMSYSEQQYLIRKTAKESSKKQCLTDAEKIKLGWKWVEFSDRGIKSRKLVKTEK